METPPSNQTSCSTDERPGRRSPRLSTSSMGTAAEEVFDDEDLICVMRAKDCVLARPRETRCFWQLPWDIEM